MNQGQLKPSFSNHFKCDDCQKEFYQTTAYAPDSSLKETYCVNCVEITEEPKIKPSKKKISALLLSKPAKICIP